MNLKTLEANPIEKPNQDIQDSQDTPATKSNTRFQLTKEQAEAKEEILKFVRDPLKRTFTLKGYAGTGKTTLIQELVQTLGSSKKIALTAPTNKAVAVLLDMSRNWGLKSSALTSHSLLGLRLVRVFEKGEMKEVFQQTKESSKLSSYNLIVVDEASMVNEELYTLLTEEVREYPGTKILFVGDPAQLPPVGEKESLSLRLSEESYKLKSIVRQAKENPIIVTATGVRKGITFGEDTFERVNKKHATEDMGVWFTRDKDFFLRGIRKKFTEPEFYTSPGHARVLCWTNNKTKYYNKLIRKMVYPDVSEPYVVGESIIAKSTVQDPIDFREVALANSEEAVILDVGTAEFKNLKCYMLTLLVSGKNNNVVIRAINPEEENYKEYKERLGDLLKEAKTRGKTKDSSGWVEYFNFRDSFGDIDYTYAMTVHKSQGSTFENVFVDEKDINKNTKRKQERQQCKYVAFTRPSKKLIVYY